MDGPKEPGSGPEKVPEPLPDEVLEDAFGNEAEHLWWVPMEFIHEFINEFENGKKVRFTFRLKVAGRDEEDARSNAEGVTIDDIVDDNPDFDGLSVDEIFDALDESDSVCEIDWEDLPDDALDCPLRVDNEECVEECFD